MVAVQERIIKAKGDKEVSAALAASERGLTQELDAGCFAEGEVDLGRLGDFGSGQPPVQVFDNAAGHNRIQI
jgi:hypothetical protein